MALQINPSDDVSKVLNCVAIEDQLITFVSAPTSGNLILSFKGNAMAAMLFSAINAANLQAALRLVAGLGAVVVTGSVAAGLNVQFVGYVGNAPMLVDASSTLDQLPTIIQVHKGRG